MKRWKSIRAFEEIGKRMLFCSQEGIAGLRDKRIYAMSEAGLGEAFTTSAQ